VLDAIYPNPTLRNKVECMCGKYIEGAQWLLYQGIPAYRAFTGREPDAEAMRRFAENAPPQYPRHIAFVGFMGTGKSTVAQLTANRLQMPVADIDNIVEKQCNDTITNIIRQRGEPYFRAIEAETIDNVLQRPAPTVISCGGGAIVTPAVRAALRQNSIVVWLYATPEQCLARIDNITSRPMLMQGDAPLTTAKKLFAERKALYAQTAWMLVNTENKTTEQVTEIIYDEVSRVFRH
jgi:shikimate kinase